MDSWLRHKNATEITQLSLGHIQKSCSWLTFGVENVHAWCVWPTEPCERHTVSKNGRTTGASTSSPILHDRLVLCLNTTGRVQVQRYSCACSCTRLNRYLSNLTCKTA
ncbi:unnamed protein product, partial [Ectocarpus sp. 8 AP-2014]